MSSSLRGDFGWLWTASTISALGDGLRYAAMPLLAARISRDPTAVALVTAAQGLAWLVLGLPSGALADRWDRRRTMIACDAIRFGLALILAVLVAAGWASITLLVLVGFLLSAAETVFYGAVQAAIPAVVVREDLPRANGRLIAAGVLGRGFLGPPTGGALFVLAAAVPFAVDALSFGLASLLTVRIRADLSGTGAAGRTSLHAEVRDGLRWLWRHAELRTIVLLLVIWSLAESAAFAVMVLWSLEVLRLPESGYGLLIAALAGGGVVGSLLAERVGRWLGLGGAMAVDVAVTVLAYLGLGLVRSPLPAAALLALVGLVAFGWNVITVSFRQAVVPVSLQGRVGSASRFASWGVVAVGAVAGGALARWWGLQAPFLVAAAALALAGAVALPRLSNARICAALCAAHED